MAIQAEQQSTPVSSDGADAFRVVLMVTVGLVLAGSLMSMAASPIRGNSMLGFGSPLHSLMTIYSVSMTTFVSLIPLVALAVVALRGLRQFPWLGWLLPVYIFLLGLNGYAGFLANPVFLGGDAARPNLNLLFSVVLMVAGGVLFLIRPRPAPSTEPTV